MSCRRTLSALAALLGLCALLSCSGGDRAKPAPLPEGAAGGPAAALPGLGGLPAPTRDLSALGADGFLGLDPLYPIASANAVDGGGYLQLDNTGGGLAYALYAVGGFDGDNYPASVLLDVGGGATQFYLAFSDYVAGNWAISGPFTGDGEFGLPQLGEYSNPAAYTSPARVHYLAVVVPAGGLVNLDGLALGVGGGSNGPRPVISGGASGPPGSFYVEWRHSPSQPDPDFGGYIVERAPAFSGSFAPLAPLPSPIPHFNDATAAEPEQYRYRIVTYDLAGHSAPGLQFVSGPQSGEEPDPVLVVRLPHGPLYGPAAVTVDLSGSYDPAGEGLSSSEVIHYAPNTVATAGPFAALTLPPGCHVLDCRVECADGRNSGQFHFLKILPRWEAASAVVQSTEATLNFAKARLDYFHLGVQPADGLTTICGFDASAAALTFWHQQGAEMLPWRVPRLEEVNYIGEPVVVGDALLFPVSTTYTHNLAGFDGQAAQVQSLRSTDAGHWVQALARDAAGRIWSLYCMDDAGNEKVVIMRVGDPASSAELFTASDGVYNLDAVYHPASGHVFAFFDDGTALNFAEWDPDAGLVADSGPLGIPFFSNVCDAEINPENGRVGVLYFDMPTDRIRYVEQNGIGGWAPPLLPDNSADNRPEAELTPGGDGRLHTCFALDATGQVHHYTLDAGIWGITNTVAYSADSGYEIASCEVPGSGDIRVADDCADGVIRFARLRSDGTENMFTTLASAVGQGVDMHAAAGVDGLHLIYSTHHDPLMMRHLVSAPGLDQGDTWVNKAVFPATSGLNLAANAAREIYATGQDLGWASLYFWDPVGEAFISDQTFPALSFYRPMLGPDALSSSIAFGVWNPVATNLNYITGTHGAWNPFAPLGLSDTPVWEGLFGGILPPQGFFCLAGGGLTQPGIGYYPLATTEFLPLGSNLLPGEMSPFGKASTAGRLVDEAAFWDRSSPLGLPANCWLCVSGSLFSPARFILSAYTGTITQAIELGSPVAETELRRTVSSEIVSGVTAVDLVASLDGAMTYFAWSNFGQWEELALPDGLDGLSLPLVVCGNDGRWHIIYKNWKDDSIMIRSTV